jgi:spore coat polysaccharide biosynthesis predicted glycosyltransferase SpsG
MVSVLQLEGIEARIKVLVGVANPHLGALQRLTDRARAVEIICDADNMAEIMAWADLAVAAGGSTCWELAYMGLPMALVVLADNQRAIAVGLDREGAAINLGWHGSLNTEHTTTMLAALLRDAGRRHAMSRRGRDLVDGRGASRVVATLMENWI